MFIMVCYHDKLILRLSHNRLFVVYYFNDTVNSVYIPTDDELYSAAAASKLYTH